MLKYTEVINEIIQKTAVVKKQKNLNVKQWFAVFLSDYCQNVKKTTFASYQQAVNNHINRILGEVMLNQINSEVIQFFIKVLDNGDEDCKPLCAKSIKNVYGVLHKGLDIAYKLGYMSNNIENMVVVLPRVKSIEISPLTNDEIVALLSEIEGSQYSDIITTAIFTGMRESELLGLRWCDIDFKSGTINITHQLIRDKISHKYVLTSPKSNRSRSIKPAPFVIEQLKKNVSCNKQDYVFTNKFGEHLSHNAVYRYLKKAAFKAFNRENVRFHDLRHTYAVISLQAGDDYKTLQENMGHYSASFTLDRYGHCTDAMRSISSQRMENFYIHNLKEDKVHTPIIICS